MARMIEVVTWWKCLKWLLGQDVEVLEIRNVVLMS